MEMMKKQLQVVISLIKEWDATVVYRVERTHPYALFPGQSVASAKRRRLECKQHPLVAYLDYW